jgi:hypothetical protein
MIRTIALLLACAALAPCENRLTRRERKEGFELLFDGKTLDHWHSIRQTPGAGSWRVRNGILTFEKGGSWLATDETFYDFVLRLEYRTGESSASGAFLRSGHEGDPAFTGMKLQILSDAGKPPDARSTGSIFGAVAPTRNMAKPDGEWNRMEVTLIKREMTVVWNGQQVLDLDLDDPQFRGAQERPLAERLADGHIGLQAHATGAPVEFRNIRIKVLKAGRRFQ